MRLLNSLFLFFITFLFIFGPVFRQIGAWMDSIFLTSVLLAFYGFFYFKLQIPGYLKYFYTLIIVYLYSLVTITLYGDFEVADYIRNLLIPVRILVTLYAGFTLVVILRRKFQEKLIEKALIFIYLSILIHAVIMTLQLIYPEFKDWIYNYTSTGDFRGSYEYDFRMGGLTGSSGDSILSVVQSVGIIIIPLILKYIKATWKPLLILGGALIFYSILISGRSGVWSSLVFLPVTVYLLSESTGFKFFITYLFNISIFVFLFFLVIQLFDKLEVESPTYYALRRSLDTFLTFSGTGEFKDNTVNVLSTHVQFPNNFSVLIFGNAEHLIKTQFDRTLNSDIGYIRNIWSFGIIISCFFWYPLIRVIILAYKNLKKYPIAAVLFSIVLIMITFQAKENYYYVRMFLSILSIILFCLYIETKKHEIESATTK